MSAATCPDCTGAVTDGRLTHDLTCPLGLDLDRACQADARFFTAHPFTKAFWRKIELHEIEELRHAGICPDAPGQAVGRVLVTNIAPGVRTRWFGEVLFILDRDAA
jgi:hypothetical protein